MSSCNKKFYEEGLNFSCQRCSYCCGTTPGFVYLSRRDLEKLCDFFKLEPPVFAEKYCRWVNYYYGKTVLALFEEKNCDCVLWNNGCSAYEARPIQCSTYPFWTWMIEDKDTWNECGTECKGINSGKKWTKEEIEEQSRLYSENEPITQEEFQELYQRED